MTIEEAVRHIRREAGKLRRIRKALEKGQRAIKPPSEDEVLQMQAGSCPLSVEAHLIGALQKALIHLNDCESELRFAALRSTLAGLEEDWKRGRVPKEFELRPIRAGLQVRKKAVAATVSRTRRVGAEAPQDKGL